MNTPTPRTDDSETRVRKNGFSPLIEYCYANDMAKLERELTAVKEKEIFYQLQVEQRDRFADYLKNTETELIAVTEQRDRLADALEHSMKHMRHSLNCPARVLQNLHPCNCQMELAFNNTIEALRSLTPNKL